MLTKRKKRPSVFTSRDREIVLFLWKWKLLTTAAIGRKFFLNGSPDATFRRLEILMKRGYITLLCVDGKVFYWTLSNNGFNSLKGSLPELKDVGFKSECLKHDHLVSTVHLGPWLKDMPADVELFSEQELRRYDIDLYPDWIPHTKRHRPDGYWRVPFKSSFITVSLEVELHQKRSDFYTDVAEFYSDHEDITRIIWIVPKISLGRLIQEKLRVFSPSGYLIHNFACLSDIERLGWQAPFFLGYDSGKSMAYLLENRVALSCAGKETLPNFDTRKRFSKSIVSIPSATPAIPNRVAISATLPNTPCNIPSSMFDISHSTPSPSLSKQNTKDVGGSSI